MNACPHCGSSLPERRGVVGRYAPVWALCRSCAWPLNRDSMLKRLVDCRAEVTAVLMTGPEGSAMRTLTGDDVLTAIDELAMQADAVTPLCEAAGMVAFAHSSRITFFLFDGESVHTAVLAMAAR